MYYRGNAATVNLNSFVLRLKDAVKRKVDEDKYRKVATVYHMYVDESSLRLVESSSFVRKMPAGAIVTAAVGGLAMLGGALGLMYYKKRVGSNTPSSEN